MSMITEVTSAQAGVAHQIAIASTVPILSGGWTTGAYVGAAITDASGMMKVIAWNWGEPSAGLVRNGSATWTHSTQNVAIAGLDANRFVTAHVDKGGFLNVGIWAAGALEYPGGGGPPADPLVWLQYGASGSSATEVAIATLSSTKVVTAVRDSGGNLRVDFWEVTGELAPPGESVGILGLSSSIVAGPATNVAIAAVSSDQAVAAFRHAGGSDNGKLVLVAFKASDGNLTRESTFVAGDVSQVSIARGGPQACSVSTATTNDKGVVEFNLWSLSTSGDISRLDSAAGFGASRLALCSVRAGSDHIAVAATFGSSGVLEMQVWDKDNFGGVYAQSMSIQSTSAISAAAQGFDNEGRGYLLTATRDVKTNDLRVQSWSLHGAAVAPSQLGGFTNYVFGSNGCSVLRDIEVTIEITEDLILESTVTNKGKPQTKSCAFQLNANSAAIPKNGNPKTWIAWQQYIFGIDGTVIEGAINNWSVSGLANNNLTISSPAAHLDTLAEAGKVPKGHRFTYKLRNDSSGNVTEATFEVFDPKTEKTSTSRQVITEVGGTPAEVAPIVALQVNLVGPGNLSKTKFSSGKGTITYSAEKAFSALPAIPECAGSQATTGEASNSIYGVVPSGAHLKFVQTFSV